MARQGRRAVAPVDTRPGQVLALALLANLPVLVGFVLAPLLSGGSPEAARAMVPVVLWATPLLAAASLLVFARAPPDRRRHRASRLGLVLDVVALALWALVLALA